MDGRTRGRLSGAAAAIIALTSAAGEARATDGLEQRGVFALLGGTPRIVSTARAQPSGTSVTLEIRQFQPDGKTPIVRYDVDMQMLMHLVIVRDDLRTFLHVHPAFDPATGAFRQTFSKQAGHRYYVFADTTPAIVGQQVYRFTIATDGTMPARQPAPAPFAAAASPPRVSVGPYSVTLARTTLRADQPQTLDVTVLRAGHPAHDLTTYLGAAAHAVFIETATLGYVHVHPTLRGAPAMTMGAGENMVMRGQAGPLMTIAVPALPSGTYRLWIQFAARGGAPYTAPFTLSVR